MNVPYNSDSKLCNQFARHEQAISGRKGVGTWGSAAVDTVTSFLGNNRK